MVLRPRIHFDALSAEARQTAEWARATFPKQFVSLGTFILRKLERMPINELDLRVERPPRQGMFEDEPRIFMEYHGIIGRGAASRSIYSIADGGDVGVLITVGTSRSTIEGYFSFMSIGAAVERLRAAAEKG